MDTDETIWRASEMTRKFALAFLSLLITVSTARSETIRGKVTDGQDQTLPYASVTLEGTARGTSSDENGAFVLTRVSPGTHTVVVSYIGYQTSTQQVELAAGQSLTLDIQLNESTLQGDEIVVYGEMARGQAAALQKQRTSVNIRNVVSEEMFNRFPDRNAAETVRRLPGISVDRDQGEGEMVQIRGIDQEYNSLTINGVRIPAPDEEDGIRSVGLDLINNKMLGEIEVVKAITPDMEADAIGGAVNFGLRNAPPGGIVSVGAGFGLNDQTSDYNAFGRDIQDFFVVLGNRFSENRLGILVDGAYYKTNRQSKLKGFEYDDGDGSIDEIIFQQYTRDYDVKRRRMGTSFTADYRISPISKLYLTTSYNVYLDDEVRREVEYRLEDEEEERTTRNRVEDQRLALVMAGGEHDLGPVQVDYKGAWIRATEALPDRSYWRFERDNPFTGLSNEQAKDLDGTDKFTGLDPLELNRLRWDNNLKEDEDLTGQVNFTVPFVTGESVSNIRFGGKLLHKNVSFDRNRFELKKFIGGDPITPEGTFGFENQRFNHPAIQSVLDLSEKKEKDKFTDSYDASENVTSVYAMGTFALSPKLTTVIGGRFEKTSTDYMQPFPETRQSTPLTGTGGYSNFMPSAHVTYRFENESNLRLAYSAGLARPRYENLVPRRVVDDDDRQISYGNPDLEPRTAFSLDAMYERYTSHLGFLGFGLFYKRFKAFHTTLVGTEDVLTEEDGIVAYETKRTVMGDGTAEYIGAEFSFNQRLGALSSSLDDFSIYGTYNYTWSEGDVGGRKIPLTNSPKHTTNLSLMYENAGSGTSFVVAANYRDVLLFGVGGTDTSDRYFDQEFHLDFSVVQKINDKLTVTGQLNGLTARQEREVFGNPHKSISRIQQWEEYGPYGTLGLQYSFF